MKKTEPTKQNLKMKKMKKMKKCLLSFLALAILFASCSKEELDPQGGSGQGQDLDGEPTVATINIDFGSSAPESRIVNNPADDDAITNIYFVIAEESRVIEVFKVANIADGDAGSKTFTVSTTTGEKEFYAYTNLSEGVGTELLAKEGGSTRQLKLWYATAIADENNTSTVSTAAMGTLMGELASANDIVMSGSTKQILGIGNNTVNIRVIRAVGKAALGVGIAPNASGNILTADGKFELSTNFHYALNNLSVANYFYPNVANYNYPISSILGERPLTPYASVENNTNFNHYYYDVASITSDGSVWTSVTSSDAGALGTYKLVPENATKVPQIGNTTYYVVRGLVKKIMNLNNKYLISSVNADGSLNNNTAASHTVNGTFTIISFPNGGHKDLINNWPEGWELESYGVPGSTTFAHMFYHICKRNLIFDHLRELEGVAGNTVALADIDKMEESQANFKHFFLGFDIRETGTESNTVQVMEPELRSELDKIMRSVVKFYKNSVDDAYVYYRLNLSEPTMNYEMNGERVNLVTRNVSYSAKVNSFQTIGEPAIDDLEKNPTAPSDEIEINVNANISVEAWKESNWEADL